MEQIRPGDVFHVPGCAKHAFRNRSSEPAVMIVTTTSRIGRFFREVASPPAGGDPLLHFLATSERYGYWNATPRRTPRSASRCPETNGRLLSRAAAA